MTDSVEKFLNRILTACEGKRYLFRGTTKILEGEDKVDSSLYRWTKDKVVFHEKYRPFNIEEEILKKAKRHFADSASNIEILTNLQHFQGKTNLIDFSHSLYIALFFACDEEHHKDPGELILLDSANVVKKSDVVYAELQSSSAPFSIDPANTQFSQKRVTFQNSVFVYPPSGYINKDLCIFREVPANLKQSILDHLRKIHNIHTDTIYNDLIGFIANEKNYETSAVLFHQGFASHNKGKYKEAIEKYDEAIELNPVFAEAYNNRGLAKGDLKQYQEAIADYEKAIELDPNDADAYNNRGIAKNNLGQPQEAIADYNKAIELNPNYAETYNNRGIAKSNLEQHQEAISDFNKAIELNPNYAEIYTNRGFVKNKLRQHQEAIADYNKAIELDPNDVKAYNSRAILKNELGEHEEAMADCDKAIELELNYAKAYCNRGIAKFKSKKHQEAMIDFNKAIELDPNDAMAYDNRGVANKALGRTQQADEDFKMAAKLKSDEAL